MWKKGNLPLLCEMAMALIRIRLNRAVLLLANLFNVSREPRNNNWNKFASSDSIPVTGILIIAR